SKKKAKIIEKPNPQQTLQPDLRLPPRLFATDRFPTKRLNIYSSPEIFGSYDRILTVLITVKIKPSSWQEEDHNCRNQAVVSVTFRFEAPQITLRPVKAIEDVFQCLAGARSYASEGPNDYNLLGNVKPRFSKSTLILLTPTSPELDVKKPQDIVRPGSLSL
ncbi:hypothetical protein HID58_055819, partial [Brassica napus]